MAEKIKVKNIFGLKIICKRDEQYKKYFIFGRCVYSKKRKRFFEGIAFKIFEFLQRFFPKKTYILFDNCLEERVGCVDAYAMYLYMRDRGIDCYYVIWKGSAFYDAENVPDDFIVLEKPINKAGEFFFRSFFKLLRTRAVIAAFGNLNRETAEFLYQNKYINYIYIDHGYSFLKESSFSPSGLNPKIYNKILTLSDPEKDMFLEHGWKQENLLYGGMPRWDGLKKLPHDKKTIFFMFTWRRSFVFFNKKEVDFEGSVYFRAIKEFFENESLKKMLKDNNIKLVCSIHHALREKCKDIISNIADDVEIADPLKLNEYIERSDLLITDYSSVLFDFLFMGVPVIFYRPDHDDQSLNGNDRMDMKTAKSKDEFLFNTFYNLGDVLDKIEFYINNGFVLEEEYLKKSDKFFWEKENIREKLLKRLEEL